MNEERAGWKGLPSSGEGARRRINHPFLRFVIVLIRGYQLLISPLFPPACRFYPTCSSYCIQALEKYGLLKGCALGARRILRCHPFNPGGYDPVP